MTIKKKTINFRFLFDNCNKQKNAQKRLNWSSPWQHVDSSSSAGVVNSPPHVMSHHVHCIDFIYSLTSEPQYCKRYGVAAR